VTYLIRRAKHDTSVFHFSLLLFSLPGGLLDAGDLAFIYQVPETNAANAVVAQVRVRAAADLAAVVAP